jgi:hypothetical protein
VARAIGLDAEVIVLDGGVLVGDLAGVDPDRLPPM